MSSLNDLIVSARTLRLSVEAGEGWAEDLADTALLLASAVSEAQAELDLIKPVLRAAADAKRDDDTHVNWVSKAGSVSVTFPTARWKLDKSADMSDLKDRLGPSFERYFTERVSYAPRKDLEASLSTRTASEGYEEEVSTVFSALVREEPPPRVGFKPANDLYLLWE